MDFEIKTIPHNEQRYETVGDWKRDKNGVMQIRVSDMGNPDYEFLVALHELIESYYCIKNGITEDVVDKWDFNHPDSNDPGMLLHCPYQPYHFKATLFEERACLELGCDWSEYDKSINKLFREDIK